VETQDRGTKVISGLYVYGASKAEAEKALWKFRDKKKPHFRINSVPPATNFGPVITSGVVASTGKFVPIVYGGNVKALTGVLPRESSSSFNYEYCTY